MRTMGDLQRYPPRPYSVAAMLYAWSVLKVLTLGDMEGVLAEGRRLNRLPVLWVSDTGSAAPLPTRDTLLKLWRDNGDLLPVLGLGLHGDFSFSSADLLLKLLRAKACEGREGLQLWTPLRTRCTRAEVVATLVTFAAALPAGVLEASTEAALCRWAASPLTLPDVRLALAAPDGSLHAETVRAGLAALCAKGKAPPGLEDLVRLGVDASRTGTSAEGCLGTTVRAVRLLSTGGASRPSMPVVSLPSNMGAAVEAAVVLGAATALGTTAGLAWIWERCLVAATTRQSLPVLTGSVRMAAEAPPPPGRTAPAAFLNKWLGRVATRFAPAGMLEDFEGLVASLGLVQVSFGPAVTLEGACPASARPGGLCALLAAGDEKAAVRHVLQCAVPPDQVRGLPLPLLSLPATRAQLASWAGSGGPTSAAVVHTLCTDCSPVAFWSPDAFLRACGTGWMGGAPLPARPAEPWEIVRAALLSGAGPPHRAFEGNFHAAAEFRRAVVGGVGRRWRPPSPRQLQDRAGVYRALAEVAPAYAYCPWFVESLLPPRWEVAERLLRAQRPGSRAAAAEYARGSGFDFRLAVGLGRDLEHLASRVVVRPAARAAFQAFCKGQGWRVAGGGLAAPEAVFWEALRAFVACGDSMRPPVPSRVSSSPSAPSSPAAASSSPSASSSSAASVVSSLPSGPATPVVLSVPKPASVPLPVKRPPVVIVQDYLQNWNRDHVRDYLQRWNKPDAEQEEDIDETPMPVVHL